MYIQKKIFANVYSKNTIKFKLKKKKNMLIIRIYLLNIRLIIISF